MYRFKIVNYSNKMLIESGVSDNLDNIFDIVENYIIKTGINVYVLVEKEK